MRKHPWKQIFQLFSTMLKIGAFTFGGGYAMIAFLESELVTRKKWIEKDEFLDMVAIAESTPGPVAINSATYIGYKVSGVVGSLVATLGMVLPAFTLIYVISLFFDRFLSLTYVGYAFKGIQVCVVYMILTAGLKLLKSLPKTAFSLIILVVVMVGMVGGSLLAINFSSIYYILLSGLAGWMVFLVTHRGKKGGEG